MPDTASEYVRGEADPRRQDHATYGTKPPAYHGGRWDSGAGYPRWRSTEWRPETSRQGSEDVYVPVHRLTAVVACFDADVPLPQIVDALDGADVHHESGIPWDNRPDNLLVTDHGTHSAITQAQMRAWGADAKEQARDDGPDAAVCGRCGDEADVFCASPDWTGRRCVECAQAESDGAPIEVLE